MSTIDRSYTISDVLDLSKKNFQENTIDLSADVKDALSDYIKDKSIISDKRSLENIMNKIDTDLQIEESIVMVLRAMKFSQTKSFSVQNKSILPSKTQDPIMDNKSIKNFHLSSELSRKLLDHQFITRKKMIQTQLEKALCDMSFKRQYSQISTDFVPATTNQEFITLVGFNEVIDLLKEEQLLLTPDSGANNSSQVVPVMCADCGTDSSPAWKKRKTSATVTLDNRNEQTIIDSVCSQCSAIKMKQLQCREFEDQIRTVRSQFDEQERNLVRDYQDMLSSPKKLEMFRQEQEKRQRIQRMGSGATVAQSPQPPAPCRPSRVSSGVNAKLFGPQVPGKSSALTQLDPAPNTISTGPSNGVDPKMVLRTGSQTKENAGSPQNTVANGEQVSYLQLMKMLSLQAINCQPYMDREQAQQLEQIFAMLQANPGLVTNNNNNNTGSGGAPNNSPPLMQLLAKLSSWQDNISKPGNNSGNGAANPNLMNLLSYFANWMQSQPSQTLF